jgi:hypothetical protein
MAINIPMPGDRLDSFTRGLNSGSALFSRIMQPILQREQQRQLENHFQKQMAMRQQQMKQSMANSDLQRSLLAQQLIHAKNANDPMYEINNLKAMENMFAKNQPPNMPSQEVGEGKGVFSPEGLAAAQGNMQGSQDSNIDYAMLQQHPALRGYFKKHFGFDPLTKSEGASYHGAARDAFDLERLRKSEGEDSRVYKNALNAYNASLDAKQDLRDLRSRTKSGLRPGEKEFFDPDSGAPLGKEIPLSAKDMEAEEGNTIFNKLYPLVYKGASQFSGKGSIQRLQDAAANYKTDPKAKKLFDDFLLAEKALAATVVNEASTLKAGKTNTTYKMLKESLEAQDIPRFIKRYIKEYNIPASAQLKAAMRYHKALSDARVYARKSTPATRKLFYDPERQAQHEESMMKQSITSSENVSPENISKKDISTGSPPRVAFKDDDKVDVRTPQGVTKSMTYAEAKKLGAI